jgi:dipeptidyl aminopeptidase/acylaminoacyl peptidase
VRITLPVRRRLPRCATAGALIALALIVYLGLSASAAEGLTRAHPGFAPHETPDMLGLAYQDVRFSARGGDVTIAGWYIPSAALGRALVLVHGKSVNRYIEFNGQFLRFAAAMHRRGFTVLMIDLRGHGQSGGDRVTFGVQERRDIIGAVDWLKLQGFQSGRIGVLGVSMGAAAGIGAAADDPDIGALVADCSYSSMDPLVRRVWRGTTGLPDFFRPSAVLMGRLLGYDFGSASPIDEIARIAPRPVLIIHGREDRFIPITEGEQLAAAGPSAELWAVPGAGHGQSYGMNPQAYVERVAAFFTRYLGEV